MLLHLKRYEITDDYTFGKFYINKTFYCYMVENPIRKEKIYGQTAIPFGNYKITLRTEGGFHQRYLEKFGSEFHKGMLYLNDVPNFEYILIHIGNFLRDTDGCLLPNTFVDSANKRGYASTDAYKLIYPIIRNALLKGEEVYLKITK